MEAQLPKCIRPKDRIQYDREFLLSLRFIDASLRKPEGLPLDSDVVLNKANKIPLRNVDPVRPMNGCQDFTPSYLDNLGSRSVGGPRVSPPSPRYSGQGQRNEPRKIAIDGLFSNDEVKLNKAEKAWKPSTRKSIRSGADEVVDNDPEVTKTLEIYNIFCSILNKLTPQKFPELMKRVFALKIDSEERLKGVIDLIFEKAISEPNFSGSYANMCHQLMNLKVPSSDKQDETANFSKLLLNHCQKEFEKGQVAEEIFEKKQKELEANKDDEECKRLRLELNEARGNARRRSLGNIKLIGELFKRKMLIEAIVLDCSSELLKNGDEESLECFCKLLSTVGKELDFVKAKNRVDQYFNQMKKIIDGKKTSSRIRFMLQDVLDLRMSNWVPRRGHQGPKTIDQIHKDAEMEEQQEQIKVMQQLQSQKESTGGGGRMGWGMGGQGPHSPGNLRSSQPQNEGRNPAPIYENRPIHTNHFSKNIKANKIPLRTADPVRPMNGCQDFPPLYLDNLGSKYEGPPGPRYSGQGQRNEPRKIAIDGLFSNDEVKLNKAEKAWKPSTRKSTRSGADKVVDNDPEVAETLEIYKRFCSILNKLTPQKFPELMKRVFALKIDSEERLKGVIDLIFEKAISEPNFSGSYANMCHQLMNLKVPSSDKQDETANFSKLLLNHCQKEFEKGQVAEEIFEKKQKELEANKDDEERKRLRLELNEARGIARRRSLGNIKLIGELFKRKMLIEAIVLDCLSELLKNGDEESLECFCKLLSTVGKELDFVKAKNRVDQYFNQMKKIIDGKKTSSRIRFMLQDVLDLRMSNWVPRRGDQGPKTINQIHKDAEMEEQQEQIKVMQQLQSQKESTEGGGRMGWGMGGQGPHSQGNLRSSQPQHEGRNPAPIYENRPIHTNHFSKNIKSGGTDFDNLMLAPSGKGSQRSWGKGCSEGYEAKPARSYKDSGRPAISTLNRFSALHQSSTNMDFRVSQRLSYSREHGDRERNDHHRDGFDIFCRGDGRNGNQITKRFFGRESKERGDTNEPVHREASMSDSRDEGSRDRGSGDREHRDGGNRERGSSDRGPVKDLPAKRERTPTPPPALPKPSLSKEEMEKKSKAIIDEYLNINDLKEALQCVAELNSASMLYVFVRHGLESTLERSTIAREDLGLLLHQLVKVGTLSTQQYYKGLQEILELAEDMAVDIPYMWLYLAELITPMLHEGGIPMGQFLREISKPLVPLGKAGVLLAKILQLLCKGMTPQKVGALWIEAGLNWIDFLPEDEDVNKFVTEQKVEYTRGEEAGPKDVAKKQVLSGDELSKQLERLLQDKAANKPIMDWVEATLEEEQAASNQFVRSLMASVCGLAIKCDNQFKVDDEQIILRAELLQKYLSDEQKELQALYALQTLVVHLEQPSNLLRTFFDTLYDEDVIKEETFYRWETSQDPAEQAGKDIALKSVKPFFIWLRDPEEKEDSDEDPFQLVTGSVLNEQTRFACGRGVTCPVSLQKSIGVDI